MCVCVCVVSPAMLFGLATLPLTKDCLCRGRANASVYSRVGSSHNGLVFFFHAPF